MSQSYSHSTGTLHEIRWSEICPGLILIKALRVTLMLRVLVLALVGSLITQWGWSSIQAVLPSEIVLPNETADLASVVEQSAAELRWQLGAPFVRGWQQLSAPFVNLVDSGIDWRTSFVLLLQGLWAIAVWALLGSAIARIAAIYLTRNETLGILSALRDAATLWPGTLGSPLIVLLATAALGVPLVVLGLLARVYVFALLTSLLWVVVLAWGLMLAIILLGLLIGWPLMWACLGVERSDAFDGVSRCYAYVYQKPLHLAAYVVVAMLLSVLGEMVVTYFADATFVLSEWTMSWGAGRSLQTDSSETVSRLINNWESGFESLAKAYSLGCLWPLATGIYLLQRRHVDATEMNEVVLADGTRTLGIPEEKPADTQSQ